MWQLRRTADNQDRVAQPYPWLVARETRSDATLQVENGRQEHDRRADVVRRRTVAVVARASVIRARGPSRRRGECDAAVVGRVNEADSSPPTISSSKHGQLPEARRRQSTGQYHSAEQQSRARRVHQRILAGGPRTADSLQRNYAIVMRSFISVVKSRHFSPTSARSAVSSDFSAAPRSSTPFARPISVCYAFPLFQIAEKARRFETRDSRVAPELLWSVC